MSDTAPRILFAASGTGGHLFPALFVAEEIKKQYPDAVIHFVGSGRPLEEKIVGGAGYPRHVIKMVGVKHRGLKGILELFTVAPAAVIKTIKLIRTLKPDVVVGVGGYASVLPVSIAALFCIPTWIHEAEIGPGLANKFLGYFVTRVSVAFQEAKMPRVSKSLFTGHPVRESIRKVVPNIAPGEKIYRLLLTGGSQGAESIDRAMMASGALLKEYGIEMNHQCRAANVEMLTKFYKEQGIPATVSSFIDDFASAYQWAHIVIGRTGAGTISELSIVNRPAILVPLPAKGIQQIDNARVLDRAAKGILVEEGGDFVPRLHTALRKLLDPAEYFTMRDRRGSERPLNAAKAIADGVLSLIRR